MTDPDGREPDPGRPVQRPSDDMEAVPGEVTPSSQGLGAVFGDAERTPKPGPVRAPGPEDRAAMDALAREFEVMRPEGGPDYLLPREDAHALLTAEEGRRPRDDT